MCNRTTSKTGVLMCVAALSWLGASPLRAEVTVRECISPPPPAGMAYELPPNSGWKMIGTLVFNHQAASDYIVNAVVFFSEGNSADTRVEYQFMLDGAANGWYTRRVPDSFPTSQALRVIIADVPAGIHTLGIRARNLSATVPVRYNRFWLSPLLLDSAESRGYASSATSISVGSTWTTILEKLTTVPAARMEYVAGFATVNAGTPKAALEYRIVRDATTLTTFNDMVPEQFPDGVHVAYIDRNVTSGSHTYRLQARSPGGSTVTFSSREIVSQSLPKFTVFEGLNTGTVSVVRDDNWYTVAQSAWQSISSLSRGAYGTDGHGHGFFTYTGALDSEAEVRFELQFQSNGSRWEIGWIGVNPSAETVLGTDISDWEQLGLTTSDAYQVSLQFRGLCNGSSPTLDVNNARFQVMVTPDNNTFTQHSCAENPQVCCANNAPACLAYSCTHSGELALVSVPSRNCY